LASFWWLEHDNARPVAVAIGWLNIVELSGGERDCRLEQLGVGGRWLDVQLPLVQLGGRGRDHRRQEEQQ
jgi:hypothetical protein